MLEAEPIAERGTRALGGCKTSEKRQNFGLRPMVMPLKANGRSEIAGGLFDNALVKALSSP